MKMIKLTTSLQISKKLKELGVPQESHFFYEYYNDKAYTLLENEEEKEHIEGKVEFIAAFTASELLELLPQRIDTGKNEPFNVFSFILQKSTVYDELKEKFYIANYTCDTVTLDSGSPFFSYRLLEIPLYSENVSDCLGALLIYLIENKLVDINVL